MNLFCLKCIEEKENFVCRINKINFFILKLIPTHIYIRMVMSTKARQSTHVQLEMLIVLYYSDRIWIQWISYQCSYRFIVWFLKFTNNQNHVQYEVRLQIQKEKKKSEEVKVLWYCSKYMVGRKRHAYISKFSHLMKIEYQTKLTDLHIWKMILRTGVVKQGTN
jgi:hypothetical protein